MQEDRNQNISCIQEVLITITIVRGSQIHHREVIPCAMQGIKPRCFTYFLQDFLSRVFNRQLMYFCSRFIHFHVQSSTASIRILKLQFQFIKRGSRYLRPLEKTFSGHIKGDKSSYFSDYLITDYDEEYLNTRFGTTHTHALSRKSASLHKLTMHFSKLAKYQYSNTFNK